jgi:hypothetical protein
MSTLARLFFLAWCVLPYHALAQATVAPPTPTQNTADFYSQTSVFGLQANWLLALILTAVGVAIIWPSDKKTNT